MPNKDQKFAVFIKVAKQLNKYDITPTIYGSLGLYHLIGQLDEINDIDIIIPNKNLVDKFDELEKIMKGIGYKRDPYYKHEFTKGNDRVGFEPESDLTKIAINPDSLQISEVNGSKFKELSPKDYLIVYKDTLNRWQAKVKQIKKKVDILKKSDS